MKQFKLLGLTLMAVVALAAALTASSASALPELLPSTAKAFTGKNTSSPVTLEAKSGTKVECKAATATGGQSGVSDGTFHITFTECENSTLGKCTSKGDATGDILSLGSFHYVLDTLGTAEESVAVLFLTTPTSFECTIFAKNEVKGTLVCLILKPLASAETHEFHCNKGTNKGESQAKGYYNDSGTFVNVKLESSLNGGAFEESNEQALASTTYGVAVAFMND